MHGSLQALSIQCQASKIDVAMHLGLVNHHSLFSTSLQTSSPNDVAAASFSGEQSTSSAPVSITIASSDWD